MSPNFERETNRVNARAAIQFVVYGGAIPAVAAVAAFWAMGRWWPRDAARRYQAGMSFAAAVVVGLICLPSTKTLAPTQFWEWIPYLGLVAALVSGITSAAGVMRGERWTAVYLFAVVAAWLLVPKWPELSPPWPIHVATAAAAIITITALLSQIPDRLRGQAFPAWLTITAACSSVLVLSEVSETFGMLAALPSGALFGCSVAAWLQKSPADWRSIAMPFTVVVGGYAYLGAVYPTSPIWPMVLIPAVPLSLCVSYWGPLQRVEKNWALVNQGVCIVAAIIAIVVMILLRSGMGDAW